MKNFKFLLASVAFFTFLFTACDKDNNSPDNEVELITTVRLTFTETGGGATTFKVTDLDGDGGNAPMADTILLQSLKQYSLSVEFLDESDAAQPHDITQEVAAEASLHQVCFSYGSAIANQNITDFDNLGKPLGLHSTVMTGVAGTGTLQVTLKHQPDKSAADACTTGETDVEVTFGLVVQ